MLHESIVRALHAGGDISRIITEVALPTKLAILDRLQQQPFVPFRVRMARTMYDVLDPEMAEVGPSTLTIFSMETGQRLRKVVLSLIHTVSIEDIEEPEHSVDVPTVILDAKNV